jgi:nucleoside-diphosphate-sugar epimerase
MHLMRENILKLLDIKLCIVRPTLVYGCNDTHNGYGPNQFTRLAQSKKNISLFGKGEERRDHIHVNDVGNAIYFLVNKKYVGTINLVTGRVNSFFKIAEKIKDLYNVKIEYIKRTSPMPHNGYRAFSNNLLKKILPKKNNFTKIFDSINKKEKYKIK